MKAQLRALLHLMWRHRRYYVGGAVFVFIGMFTTLAYPQAIRITIDEGLRGGHASRINFLALVMLGLLLAEALSTFMRNFLFNVGAEHVSGRLRQEAFGHLLKQGIAFFRQRNAVR